MRLRASLRISTMAFSGPLQRSERGRFIFILNPRVPRRVPGKGAIRRHGPTRARMKMEITTISVGRDVLIAPQGTDSGRARCPHRAASHTGAWTRSSRTPFRALRSGLFAIASLGSRGILKYAACALIAAFAIGEAGADIGVAPVNSAYLKWRKNRHPKFVKPAKATRNLLAASAQPEEGLLGLAPSIFDSSYLANLNISRVRGVGTSYPQKYDLRDQGWLTPIRNQEPYGTCWAFATYSSMESSLLKFEGKAFDFSENNLANLHGGDWGFDDGGNADLSSAYLLRWDGPVLESSDPYAKPGGSQQIPPVRHIQNVPWIPGKTTYLDNNGIKEAIIKYGALWVGYYHDKDCYNAAKASYYFPYFFSDGKRHSNHAVAVVGWDDTYSKYNFADTPAGNGAYIVRNNWGTSWGDAGYFYVSYYDETFAWETLYSFSNAESVENYESIYQYDTLGLVADIGYGYNTGYGANIYEASCISVGA